MKLNVKSIQLVFGVVFVLILLVGFGSSYFRRQDPNASPVATFTPLPTKSGEFQILNVYPGRGEVEYTTPNTAFGVEFSQPIITDAVSVNITPEIEIKLVHDAQYNILYVQPQPSWEYGKQYSIQVSARARDGRTLTETFKITPQRPRPPQGDVH